MSVTNTTNINTENNKFINVYLTDSENKYLLDKNNIYLITNEKVDEIMATKKYVSIEKLGLYDEKIKGVISAGDTAALEAANAYADSLATNYDAAGAAAAAQAAAKSYTDTEVAKANGAAATAQAAAEAAATAASTADGKAVAAQTAVDNLADYVGEIPEGATATDVIGYIQEKTTGIASEGAMTELGNRVTQAETKIGNIEKDYLKAADKTELEGKIGTAQAAADGAQSYAEGVAGDLAEAVEALEGADAGQIARIEALEGTITGLSGAMHFEGVVESDPTKITTGYEQGDVVIYGNKEYVWNNGAFVEFGDASVNAEAITALTGRVTTAEGKITSLEGAVATKVEQSAYNEKIAALEGADTTLSGRIDALDAKFGTGDGSVSDMISDAIEVEAARVNGELDKKVDKVTGKGLSTNDLTNELKGQYDAAYTHSQAAHAPVDAQANVIETVKVNGSALTVTGKAVDIAVPTDNAQLANGAGYLVAGDIANKADKATTLSGYGITDAYTTAQTDSAIAAAIGQFEECSEAEINALFA